MKQTKQELTKQIMKLIMKFYKRKLENYSYTELKERLKYMDEIVKSNQEYQSHIDKMKEIIEKGLEAVDGE